MIFKIKCYSKLNFNNLIIICTSFSIMNIQIFRVLASKLENGGMGLGEVIRPEDWIKCKIDIKYKIKHLKYFGIS